MTRVLYWTLTYQVVSPCTFTASCSPWTVFWRSTLPSHGSPGQTWRPGYIKVLSVVQSSLLPGVSGTGTSVQLLKLTTFPIAQRDSSLVFQQQWYHCQSMSALTSWKQRGKGDRLEMPRLNKTNMNILVIFWQKSAGNSETKSVLQFHWFGTSVCYASINGVLEY